MKFKIILATGMALSVMAVSANAQILSSRAGIQTGGESGGGRTGTASGLAVASPGIVISVTDRAMRDTTLHSRAAIAVAGQPARVIADAADGVVVAGEGAGNVKVFSDAGLPSVPPSEVAAGSSLLGDGATKTDAQ